MPFGVYARAHTHTTRSRVCCKNCGWRSYHFSRHTLNTALSEFLLANILLAKCLCIKKLIFYYTMHWLISASVYICRFSTPNDHASLFTEPTVFRGFCYLVFQLRFSVRLLEIFNLRAVHAKCMSVTAMHAFSGFHQQYPCYHP